MKNLFILLALFLSLASCGEQHRYIKHRKHTLVVKKYQVPNPNGSNTETTEDDFLFWYLITSNNNSYKNEFYIYGSNVPVTDFSNVSWARTSNIPVSLERGIKENPETKPEEVEVSVEELSPEFQQEIDLNQEYFDGMINEEMGDYETAGDVISDGGTSRNNAEDEDENSENETDNSEAEADASSDSDGGSSDSGGSDGGGDGGGGGGD